MNKNKPILITGCPRSGTSLVAGMLHDSGLWGGNVTKMYENKHIRETVVTPILKGAGIDPAGLWPLTPAKPQKHDIDLAPSIFKILEAQEYNGGKWFYKDFRMLLSVQHWIKTFPNAKWIIVRRNEDDVLDSCKKTAYMQLWDRSDIKQSIKAKNAVQAQQMWIKGYLQRMKDVHNSLYINTIEIWPEKLLDNDYLELQEVFQFADVSFDLEKVQKYIKPKLLKVTKFKEEKTI